MGDEIKTCIIVGSSRGLGAAIVEDLLERTPYQVIGLSRTEPGEIKNHEKWVASKRYRYVKMDIASPQCREGLKNIAAKLSPDPVCVIFNSAHIEKDIHNDRSINFEAFDAVNRVGIDGLGNILFAFEPHLLRYGGIFIGITSFWGSIPPLYLPYLAYPSSKAYLNMILRCLRVAWRKHAKVIAVNIGNIKKEGDVGLPKWFIPTYSMAARKIVDSATRKSPPKTVNYPLWHSLIYRYFLRFVPEFVYSLVFNAYLRIESSRRKNEG